MNDNETRLKQFYHKLNDVLLFPYWQKGRLAYSEGLRVR